MTITELERLEHSISIISRISISKFLSRMRKLILQLKHVVSFIIYYYFYLYLYYYFYLYLHYYFLHIIEKIES